MDDSDRLSVLREELVRRLGRQRYELWVGPQTSLAMETSTLRISSPSRFEMQWLRRRLHETLRACCQQVWDHDVAIEYDVAAPSSPRSTDAGTATQAQQETGGPMLSPEGQPASQNRSRTTVDGLANADKSSAVHRSRSKGKANLPRSTSTFHSFFVGKGNELAFRTAKAVADQLGHYGPLLLFGPPGVGKTHLVYSIVQQLRCDGSRVHCVRLTAEQFTAEFLEALDRRALPSFRQKYRTIDVLLVDDIQFFAGKRATLDELLYTMDSLHDRGRQVVFTADRSPGDLQAMSTELVSRISGGLAIPLELPDYATRLGIVRQQAARRRIALDEQVVALIAAQVAGSARQLSGALNLLLATSMAHDEPISADLARQTLKEFVQQSAPAVRLADIQRAVCQVFGVEASSLKSSRKTRSVTEPRMLAMWLARKYTRAALGEISEFFGRRSHSTVISAHRKVERLMSDGADISMADRPCPVEEAIRQVEAVLRTA